MVHQLSNETDIKQAILHIGAQKAGSNIMAKKANNYLFLIKNIKTPAANILKQDALSIGAELAVDSSVIVCQKDRVDGILICNEKQL